MNKYIVKSLLILTVVMGFATQADASLVLAVGDAFYVGKIDNGAPADPASEVLYINTLTTLGTGAGPTTIGTEDYDRIGSTHPGPFATAVTTDTMREDTGDNTHDLGTMTFQYILAKAGGFSVVWYNAAGFTGEVEVPSDLNGSDPGGGLSHTSFYNKGVIPEPGTIAVWGLLALCGFAVAKKKKWRQLA